MDNVLNIGKGLVGKALYSKEGGKRKIRKQEMLNLGTSAIIVSTMDKKKLNK